MHQLSMPGMPRDGVVQVSLHCRVWGDGSLSGYIALSSGATAEELDEFAYQCSRHHSGDKRQEAIRALSMMHRLIVSLLAENPWQDPWAALDEANAIYGQLF